VVAVVSVTVALSFAVPVAAVLPMIGDPAFEKHAVGVVWVQEPSYTIPTPVALAAEAIPPDIKENKNDGALEVSSGPITCQYRFCR